MIPFHTSLRIHYLRHVYLKQKETTPFGVEALPKSETYVESWSIRQLHT